MNLRFSKMHGLGNDFMVLDAINQSIDLAGLDISKLADRRFGIGFDQLLVVEASTNPKVDFRYRIFNADGSEVQQCGNGARCFARFVKNEHLSEKNPIHVETESGIISLELVGDEQVRVDMGPAILEAEKIPVLGQLDGTNQLFLSLPLSLENHEQPLKACVLSMGNPHAVFTVENFDDAAIYQVGFALQNHEAFPERVNVGFMQIIDKSHIKLRVFERGVGETLACGSGACAAVVAGILQGKLDNKVKVSLTGGELDIEWQGGNSHVLMQGEATLVYTGETDI